jgi:hypothetical protein
MIKRIQRDEKTRECKGALTQVPWGENEQRGRDFGRETLVAFADAFGPPSPQLN